jgi:hypothetical protein
MPRILTTSQKATPSLSKVAECSLTGDRQGRKYIALVRQELSLMENPQKNKNIDTKPFHKEMVLSASGVFVGYGLPRTPILRLPENS